MAVTWNPADKAAEITLSNGDLTATATASMDSAVRATTGKASGKWYWEVTVGSPAQGDIHIGIGTILASVAYNNYVGEDVYGYGYRFDNGNIYNDFGGTAYGNAYIADDIISVALDMDNGKVFFAINGVWQNSGDPVAGTGEAVSGLSDTFFPMASIPTGGNYLTANFGASAFSYSVPSGFIGIGIDSELNATIPQIEPFLGGAGLLTPTISAIEPFLGGGGLLASTFPVITPIMEGSDDLNHGNIYLTLPSLSASITQAITGTLTATIPTITAVINESVSRGNVSATLPLITVDVLGGVGSFLEVDLPLITPDIISGVLLNVDIPMMTISAEGVCGEVGELEITLPTITVSTIGKVEILGSIDTSLPTLQAHVKGLTGKLITGDITLPTVQADIAGYNDLTGDIDSTVAMLTAYMTGTPTRFAAYSYILRYNDLPDCLGSILTELPIIAVSIED